MTMSRNVLQTTCCVFVIILCIDRGDGKWKEKDRETLRHDIELYKRMADKIEREIEAFYDEYPEDRLEDDNIDSMHYKYASKPLDKRENVLLNKLSNRDKKNTTYNISNRTNERIKVTRNQVNVKSASTKNAAIEDTKWPTFEDILLSLGKKYDWKNDRWIKVKEKLYRPSVRVSQQKVSSENSVDFHEKHNFSYKFVKLNRSKNRRSVVVAVSAVR